MTTKEWMEEIAQAIADSDQRVAQMSYEERFAQFLRNSSFSFSNGTDSSAIADQVPPPSVGESGKV